MPTVLVVDDCLTDRRRAGGLLNRSGFDVAYAADGREALDRLAAAPPPGGRIDAVLTDLQMPEMNGLELVAAVVRDHPFTPVVVMTSQGSEQVVLEALTAGAASYVPKRDLADRLGDTFRRLCDAATADKDQARLAATIVRQEVTYEIGADLSLIAPAARAVRDLLAGTGRIDEAAVMRSGIAFEEALLNAVYHGNLEVASELREQEPNAYYDLARRRCGEEPYRRRSVRIDVAITPDEARIRIADDGPGFDLAALPDPTDPENIIRASGRGLLLIRTFMDEVSHNARGNEVTLVKRLRPAAACCVRRPVESAAAG